MGQNNLFGGSLCIFQAALQQLPGGLAHFLDRHRDRAAAHNPRNVRYTSCHIQFNPTGLEIDGLPDINLPFYLSVKKDPDVESDPDAKT